MMNKNIFVACDLSSQKETLDLLELVHNENFRNKNWTSIYHPKKP